MSLDRRPLETEAIERLEQLGLFGLGQASATSIRTPRAQDFTRNSTRPPEAPYFRALTARLSITWPSRWESTRAT